MRLIDADAIDWEKIEKRDRLYYRNSYESGIVAMKHYIAKQPTAYDVDKVVEQLHKTQVYKFQGKLPDGRICHFSDVIEIVKAGGVNE